MNETLAHSDFTAKTDCLPGSCAEYWLLSRTPVLLPEDPHLNCTTDFNHSEFHFGEVNLLMCSRFLIYNSDIMMNIFLIFQ